MAPLYIRGPFLVNKIPFIAYSSSPARRPVTESFLARCGQALERLYYLFEIRPYAQRLARALRRERKVYFYDFTEVENAGPRSENLVAVHLRTLVDAWDDRG